MNDKFFSDYFQFIQTGLESVNQSDLIKASDAIKAVSKVGKKLIIAGNGGSAAMASHVSIDFTKAAGIRAINFNEADLLTCFSNDYGYEKWVEKTVNFYGDKGDVLIVISASGKSKNMIYGCEAAKAKKFSNIITFTGIDKNNPISKLGDINFWINSKAYNFIENIHQIWLLSIVDLIIGKREYPPN